MLGPRIVGRNGVELRPPRLDDQKVNVGWFAQPESTRFWGPRAGEWTEEQGKERFERIAKSQDSVNWAIAYEGETVGFTGIFDIDWVRRDGESGLFIGRHDLYGRGIASEAVRLRTEYAWTGLRLHRVHNWIALQNRGSRRANEKAGYRQIGLFERYGYRSGAWMDDWMGEVFPEQVFTSRREPATLSLPEKGSDESPRETSSEASSSRDQAELKSAKQREEASSELH